MFDILKAEKEFIAEINHCERNIMINERHLNKIREYGSDCDAYHRDVRHCEDEIGLWSDKKEMNNKLLKVCREGIKRYLEENIFIEHTKNI